MHDQALLTVEVEGSCTGILEGTSLQLVPVLKLPGVLESNFVQAKLPYIGTLLFASVRPLVDLTWAAGFSIAILTSPILPAMLQWAGRVLAATKNALFGQAAQSEDEDEHHAVEAYRNAYREEKRRTAGNSAFSWTLQLARDVLMDSHVRSETYAKRGRTTEVERSSSSLAV